MKPFDIKIEKTNAISNYQRLQKLTTLFRFIEMLIFLFMVSSFNSSQLPFSIKLSTDYLKGITFMLFSPKFVFVIGNVIILILFFISRADENNVGMENTDHVTYEYVKNCHAATSSTITCTTTTTTSSDVHIGNSNLKNNMCRSKSYNRIKVKCEEKQRYRGLRRSVTEIERAKYGEMMAIEKKCVKDELSCEEFRTRVEAFIARQQKILRDEEFSPMVYVGS